MSHELQPDIGSEFGLNTGPRIRNEAQILKAEWNFWTSKDGMVHMTGQINKTGIPDYLYVSPTQSPQTEFQIALQKAEIFVQIQPTNETTVLRSIGKDDSQEELSRAQQSLHTILTSAGFSQEKQPA